MAMVAGAVAVASKFVLRGDNKHIFNPTNLAIVVLLAFGAKGHPAAVMSIIFAGAPIVNAGVALAIHPPAGGLASLKWQFVVGILLAALGGTMVTFYKPGPGAAKPPVVEPDGK